MTTLLFVNSDEVFNSTIQIAYYKVAQTVCIHKQLNGTLFLHIEKASWKIRKYIYKYIPNCNLLCNDCDYHSKVYCSEFMGGENSRLFKEYPKKAIRKAELA